MSAFSPREIVSELDRFIVGQNDAKRAVAIALRNRWRRQQLDDDMRDEVLPKNILMIGPTGVGKTEIARRLARLLRFVADWLISKRRLVLLLVKRVSNYTCDGDHGSLTRYLTRCLMIIIA